MKFSRLSPKCLDGCKKVHENEETGPAAVWSFHENVYFYKMRLLQLWKSHYVLIGGGVHQIAKKYASTHSAEVIPPHLNESNV